MIVEPIDSSQDGPCCNPKCENDLYDFGAIIDHTKGICLVVYEEHMPVYIFYCDDCALKFAQDIQEMIKFRAFK